MQAQEILKGIKALEEIMAELAMLGKDAILFIVEKGMHKEFMEFHTKKHIERGESK
ncbi:MAG TPA: hypothetical protein VMV86_04390 [Methanosarcinales archaeon]|nr:hypothetical protein [Methanosarcinales archaeon]